jgi:DNA processing protein
MKRYPQKISYSGRTELLKRKKVSIVGTRRPLAYTKSATFDLAQKLAYNGVCVVSGGAMGVDAIAHSGAKSANTIAVLPNGLDHKYPHINKNLLLDIENNGLLLSQFEDDFKATPWSFVVRNELVVALGDVLIVIEAELESGSMRSIEFALEMQKEIYVLPHRLGESGATNWLLSENKAKAIYSIDAFVSMISGGVIQNRPEDDFIHFCKKNPLLDKAIELYGERVYEAELEGIIKIEQGKIMLIS